MVDVSLHGFLHGIEWIVFHGHLDCFLKPPLGGRSNTKVGDHGIPNAHNRWLIGYDYRTKTIHQLLCFKNKFPNRFAFTLGRYLFLLFLVHFIGSICRTQTMHQLLCIKSKFSFPTTLRLHLDITCSCYFGSTLFSVDVNYS